MKLIKSVGRKIQSLREQKGFTQEMLGEKSGVHTKYISAIERGQKNLTIKTLEKVSEGLDVEPYELFIYPESLDQGEAVRKAIESMMKDADAKTLNLYLEFIKKASV